MRGRGEGRVEGGSVWFVFVCFGTRSNHEAVVGALLAAEADKDAKDKVRRARVLGRSGQASLVRSGLVSFLCVWN